MESPKGIINNLSQLPDLGVVSRSSVFRYKGKQADPQQVAQELKVGAVLTGRLVFHGDSVSVSTELRGCSHQSSNLGPAV